ncbi:MAG: amidohydrolase [Verrucomicrobia bacterium]|nr:amidohydrolase [Verrucomicrobiota bacterium]
MPDFPLIDTHVHLWDPGRLGYPWLAEVPALNRPFLPADYRRACGPVPVAGMVFVQCECAPAQSAAEVAWVTELARAEPRLCGIVAQAPLEKGAAAEADLARLAANPLVKGVRRLLQAEADDAFCLRSDFLRGVQLLPRYGLSFDICIYHRQLANVVTLVRQCPHVRFVLDHIGKPDIKAGRLDPWRAELRELAALPNTWCKLSGLATEADCATWTPADLQPYIEHTIETFGARRLMFGSDWPVSTLATDYPRWVATVDAALAGASPEDRHRIFEGNASECYRLGS